MSVCPAYPYMFHGTYTSYYALHYPGCTAPCSFDGPNGMRSNCTTGAGCVAVRESQPAAQETQQAKYKIHPDLKDKGMVSYPDPEGGMLPAPGVLLHGHDAVNKDVRFVEFKLGAQTLLARVIVVDVDPAKFTDMLREDYRRYKRQANLSDVYIGYEVDPAAVDPKARPVQGKVVKRDHAAVTVEVNYPPSGTLSYDVVLHEKHAKPRAAAAKKAATKKRPGNKAKAG